MGSINEVPDETTPQVPTELILASPQPSGTPELKPSLQPSGTPKDEICDEIYDEIYKVVVRYLRKKELDESVDELESMAVQLQEELKKVKDQLNLSGSWKHQAHQNAEESKKQPVAVSLELEGSKQQLLEPSGPEERAKQKFLEQYGSEKELALALQMISEQQALDALLDPEPLQLPIEVDFVTLASAMDEVQQLKVHGKVVTKPRSRLLELDPKFLELQEEMKKVKDLLSSSEWRNQGHQNAEEFKKKLSTVPPKLEEPIQEFLERFGSEEELAVELQMISQEPDPAQHSNQEAVQKQNETRQLKAQREKRCRNILPILQLKVCQLLVDLETVQDHMSLSESWKNQNAEESKEHLLAVSSKLEGSKQRLLELSGSEEGAVEHQKISQEPDPTQHSEQEAVQEQLKVEPKVKKCRSKISKLKSKILQLQEELKQNAIDSVALASAMHEIQQVMVQLGVVSESEAAKSKHLESANPELQSLKGNLAEIVSLVENMKKQLQECKETEAQAQAQARESLLKLEIAKRTVEVLRSDSMKAVEAYNSSASELDQSKAHVKLLEGLVRKLETDIKDASSGVSPNPLGDQNLELEVLNSQETGESVQTGDFSYYFGSTLQR